MDQRTISWLGVFPPFPVLFDAQRRVDHGVLSANLERWSVYDLAGCVDMLGYCGGPVRSPLIDLGDDDRHVLRDMLIEGGLLQS